MLASNIIRIGSSGGRMRTHDAYENVIVRDVFDLARRECSSPRVAVCGASLLARHAAVLFVAVASGMLGFGA
jgi:hypothetical protein